VASLARKGPLEGRAPWQGEGLRLAGSDLLSCFLLRGRPDEAMQQRMASLLGCRLPGTPIVIEHGKGAQVLMLAPCRWMIFASREASPALPHHLQEILAGSFVAVSDASDGYVHITVEGPRAIDLLAAGTAVDLYPGRFRTGHAAQTEMARIRCLIRRDGETAYSVLADVSAADYLWTWLTTNAELTIATLGNSGAS